MIAKSTVKGVWVKDAKYRWLRLPIAALRRNDVMSMVSGNSKTGTGFVYLDPESVVRVASALCAKNIQMNIAEPSSRFAQCSVVRDMPAISMKKVA